MRSLPMCVGVAAPLPALLIASASAPTPGRPALHRKRRVNQAFLMAMVEMGIPKPKAELALAETGEG